MWRSCRGNQNSCTLLCQTLKICRVVSCQRPGVLKLGVKWGDLNERGHGIYSHLHAFVCFYLLALARLRVLLSTRIARHRVLFFTRSCTPSCAFIYSLLTPSSVCLYLLASACTPSRAFIYSPLHAFVCFYLLALARLRVLLSTRPCTPSLAAFAGPSVPSRAASARSYAWTQPLIFFVLFGGLDLLVLGPWP